MNLLHLANFLDAPRVQPLKFDMWRWESACGTVACAVGHGPLAGIEMTPGEKKAKDAGVGWAVYCARAFGVSNISPEMGWLFQSWWQKKDNTPEGAAARIRYYLKHGVPIRPENKPWPVCYRDAKGRILPEYGPLALAVV